MLMWPNWKVLLELSSNCHKHVHLPKYGYFCSFIFKVFFLLLGMPFVIEIHVRKYFNTRKCAYEWHNKNNIPLSHTNIPVHVYRGINIEYISHQIKFIICSSSSHTLLLNSCEWFMAERNRKERERARWFSETNSTQRRAPIA